jgi:CheY-like chemotaxis protein
MEPNGSVAEISVLVVDDNEDIREVLAVILSGSGYRCELAKNGVEAMQRARQCRFDAVITDVEMPEMDGIALTRELRQHYSDLPVMIMTCHSNDDCKTMAFRAGAREFLNKPFAVPDLMTKLHKMILCHHLDHGHIAPSKGVMQKP